jgi:hypothetical protein
VKSGDLLGVFWDSDLVFAHSLCPAFGDTGQFENKMKMRREVLCKTVIDMYN